MAGDFNHHNSTVPIDKVAKELALTPMQDPTQTYITRLAHRNGLTKDHQTDYILSNAACLSTKIDPDARLETDHQPLIAS